MDGLGKSRKRVQEGAGLFAAPKSYYFGEDKRTVKDFIVPNGANTTPLGYMTLNDCGKEIYYSCLYIDKLSRYLTIASSFEDLFNYPGVTTTVYVHPLREESVKKINKRIDMLEAEESSRLAKNTRLRELGGKRRDAESLAEDLDAGDTFLYEVTFLLLVRRDSYDELQTAIEDLMAIARTSNMELSACYAAHPEGFLSSLPINKLVPVKFAEHLPESIPGKRFVLNEEALSTIFSHTSPDFYHKDGVLIGRQRYGDQLPFLWDPYDPSHFSYGCIIAGEPGYGKSAFVKMTASRLVDFGYTFASIDYEIRGTRGEYAAACEAVGGVSYTIGEEGGDKINLFEINEEVDFAMETQVEKRVLRVDEKVVDLSHILMSIALATSVGGAQVASYEAAEVTRMQDIVTRAVQSLYSKAGIVEGHPESLYEASGAFGSGRRKKRLPQMKDFYLELLRQAAANRDRFKDSAYALLLDKFRNMVKELYYCVDCFTEFTREEYESIRPAANGVRYHHHEGNGTNIETGDYPIESIKGAAAYFDCQSTVTLDAGVPWYNFDISSATNDERPTLILVCLNFIDEHFIKRNSADPSRAKKLIFFIDEFHRVRDEQAIQFVNATYRVARKRFVSPWIIVHSIKDLDKFADTEDIVKMTETMFLFRHPYRDRNYLLESTFLTESQVDTVLNQGGTARNKKYGEMCVVDYPTKNAIFVDAMYFKDTEEYIVETDTRNLAAMAIRG